MKKTGKKYLTNSVAGAPIQVHHWKKLKRGS